MAGSRMLCTFTLGELFCGIEVRRVQEIIRYQEMTRVPLAPPAIRGLINLRGQIVAAIDLRRRLNLADRPDGARPFNVVVRGEQEVMSLLVDAVGDVLEVNEADFEPPPELLQGPARELIRGAYKLDGRLLLLLDTDSALELNHDLDD
jgi:purine-binding chemotaxis protein CheW